MLIRKPVSEVFDAFVNPHTTTFTENGRIAFVWSDGIAVEINFHSLDANSTRLSVTARGFQDDDAQAQVVGATEGFTIELCDLKSLLETGQSGNMVRDKAALLTASAKQWGEGAVAEINQKICKIGL